MWDLIVLAPDHCLSIYFPTDATTHTPSERKLKHGKQKQKTLLLAFLTMPVLRNTTLILYLELLDWWGSGDEVERFLA